MSNWNPRHDLNDEMQELRDQILTPYNPADDLHEVSNLHAFTDSRKYLKPENQKNMGSCSANGSTTALEKAVWVATGQVHQFSRHWLYIRAQDRSNIRTDSGCSITQCVWLMKNVGTPLEKYQPYPSGYTRQIRGEADEQAQFCKIQTATKLTTPMQIYSWLRDPGRSVIIGIAWGGNLSEKGERLTRYRPAKVRGNWPGHALCLTQISPETIDAEFPDVDMPNSHGTHYGMNGMKRIAPSALEEMLEHPMTRQFGGMIGIGDPILTGPDFIDPKHDGKSGF